MTQLLRTGPGLEGQRIDIVGIPDDNGGSYTDHAAVFDAETGKELEKSGRFNQGIKTYPHAIYTYVNSRNEDVEMIGVYIGTDFDEGETYERIFDRRMETVKDEHLIELGKSLDEMEKEADDRRRAKMAEREKQEKRNHEAEEEANRTAQLQEEFPLFSDTPDVLPALKTRPTGQGPEHYTN